MLFAEDSSSWQGGVTKPVADGGLGFDYKWDMGWMYDSLYFLSLPAEQRKANYHKLTFSMWYYYTERFILSLSHDEVVGGKGTILEKMHGSEEEKFAQIRTYYAYMYMHPGKKLSFMGNELGERTEWNESREVEFELLKEKQHKGLYDWVCDLQRLYRNNEVLYAREYERDNYEWLYCDDSSELLYVMKRMDKKKAYVCVINFGRESILNFPLSLDKPEPEEETAEATARKKKKKKAEERWKTVLCSEWQQYGGSMALRKDTITSKERIMDINIPGYCAVIYEVE